MFLKNTTKKGKEQALKLQMTRKNIERHLKQNGGENPKRKKYRHELVSNLHGKSSGNKNILRLKLHFDHCAFAVTVPNRDIIN